jgi:hypothetical protein
VARSLGAAELPITGVDLEVAVGPEPAAGHGAARGVEHELDDPVVHSAVSAPIGPAVASGSPARPAAPWADVLAVLFGIGAALTLDEFALWLHLQDVWWEREGRSSVDAVLVALIVGALLLVGVNPFGDDTGGGALVAGLGVAANLLFALVACLKGPYWAWSGCSSRWWRWSPPSGWPGRPHRGRAAGTTSAAWPGRAVGPRPGGARAGTGSSTCSPELRRRSPVADRRRRSHLPRSVREPTGLGAALRPLLPR